MRKTTVIHGIVVLPALIGAGLAANWAIDSTLDVGDQLDWLLIIALTVVPAYLTCRWRATIRNARNAGYADGYLRGVADRIERDHMSR